MTRRRTPPVLRAVVWTVRPLVWGLTRREWQGARHLPRSGGFVLAANHLSYVDPLILGIWMADRGIAPRFLVKDSLFDVRGIGWILRHGGQIPVHRDTDAAAEAVRTAVAALRAGDVIAIYPEGTITRDPAIWPMSGRTGAVRAAHAAGVPLVPVAQWGPQEIMAPYRREFRPFPRKTMHVRVGEPIDLTGLGDQPTEQQLEEATDRLMAAITHLEEQIRAEAPTTPRLDVHRRDRPPATRRDAET